MVIGGKTREEAAAASRCSQRLAVEAATAASCLASPSFLPWDRSRVSSTSSESLSDGQMTCGGCCFYCAKRREEEENVGSLSNQLWNEKGIAFFSMPLLKPSTTRRNILLLTLCYVLFYTYTKLASSGEWHAATA